jgi:succinate dehydrogenase / fumarate reductase flavoprotein subunit
MYVGQGARFINARGEGFMERHAPAMKDRAYLSVLVQAIAIEAKAGNAPIYLDMTHFTTEQVRLLRVVLPLAMMMYERAGIVVDDKFTRPVEWMLTSPFGQCGVKVNSRGESNIPGLFACGEAAAYQSMGAGLMVAATHGATAGRFVAEYARGLDESGLNQSQIDRLREETFHYLDRGRGIEPDQILLRIQETITPYNVLILRHETRMKQALAEIRDIRENEVPLLCAYDPHYLRMALEARNLAFLAELHLKSAIFRTESRVAIREDYPYIDDANWLKWTEVRRGDGGSMAVTTSDIPLESYPFKPDRYGEKYLHPRWEMAQKAGMIQIDQEGMRWV